MSAFLPIPSLVRIPTPSHVQTSKRTTPICNLQPIREYERYLRQIARTAPPPYLEALLHVLTTLRSETLLPPTQRNDLHPFFIPLTSTTNSSGAQFRTGFLRWPTPPKDMPLPVVKTSSHEPYLTLLATSAAGYVTRALASADFSGRTEEAHGIRKCGGDRLSYRDGEVDESGMGLEHYLLLKTGPFPDIYESLARFHLAKGDVQSALVTCERAAGIFPGWGRAHVFHAQVLQELGRKMESRDAARFALQMPLWTLGGEVREVGRMAGYEEDESLRRIYRRLYEDERKEDLKEGKAPEQVALDRAAFLLDLCVVEGGKWEAVRERLAELYQQGGMEEFATFVRY